MVELTGAIFMHPSEKEIPKELFPHGCDFAKRLKLRTELEGIVISERIKPYRKRLS